jgi:hypothetical protein
MSKTPNKEPVYPVQSLHEFISQLDKEWTKFRNGALIGLISSGVLFLLVVGLILRTHRLGLGLVDFVLLIIAGVFLAYSIYAMYSQFRFFQKWERRVSTLARMEEQFLSQKLQEPPPPP